MSQTPNNLLTRDNIKNRKEDSDFNEEDKLHFLQKAQDFYKDIKNDTEKKTENDFEGKSGIYAIQGLRGCGKSTFADIFCRVVKQKTKQEQAEKKQFIRVKFTPRYLTKKDEFYSGLLDAIKHKLLQYKYSSSLAETIDSIKDIVQATDNSWIKSIYHIFSFLQKKSSLDDKIIELKEIINAEYKDCNIVIVLDELDRLMPDDLMEFSKVLDFLRHVIDHLDREIQVHVLVCFDKAYFGKNTIHSNSEIKILEFYAKFFKSKIDIYEVSFQGLSQYFEKELNKLSSQKNNDGKKIIVDFEILKSTLLKKRASMTIRSINLIINKLYKLQEELKKDEKRISKRTTSIADSFIFPKKYDFCFFLYLLFLNEVNPEYNLILKDLLLYDYPIYTKNSFFLEESKIKEDLLKNDKEIIKKDQFLKELKTKENKSLNDMISFHNIELRYDLIVGGTKEKDLKEIIKDLILQEIGYNISIDNHENAFYEAHKNDIFEQGKRNLFQISKIVGDKKKMIIFLNYCIKENLRKSDDNNQSIHNINHLIETIAELYERINGDAIGKDEFKSILDEIQNISSPFWKRYMMMKLWRFGNQQNTGYREFEKFLRKEYDRDHNITHVGIGCNHLKNKAIEFSKELTTEGLIKQIKEETNNDLLGYIQNIRLLYDFIFENQQAQIDTLIHIIKNEDNYLIGQMLISYTNNVESHRFYSGRRAFMLSNDKKDNRKKLLEYISIDDIQNSSEEYITRSSERKIITPQEKQEIIELLKKHQSQKSSE